MYFNMCVHMQVVKIIHVHFYYMCMYLLHINSVLLYSANYFLGYKFHGFVKILILREIKFVDCKHNLAILLAVHSFLWK